MAKIILYIITIKNIFLFKLAAKSVSFNREFFSLQNISVLKAIAEKLVKIPKSI